MGLRQQQRMSCPPERRMARRVSHRFEPSFQTSSSTRSQPFTLHTGGQWHSIPVHSGDYAASEIGKSSGEIEDRLAR